MLVSSRSDRAARAVPKCLTYARRKSILEQPVDPSLTVVTALAVLSAQTVVASQGSVSPEGTVAGFGSNGGASLTGGILMTIAPAVGSVTKR